MNTKEISSLDLHMREYEIIYDPFANKAAFDSIIGNKIKFLVFSSNSHFRTIPIYFINKTEKI